MWWRTNKQTNKQIFLVDCVVIRAVEIGPVLRVAKILFSLHFSQCLNKLDIIENPQCLGNFKCRGIRTFAAQNTPPCASFDLIREKIFCTASRSASYLATTNWELFLGVLRHGCQKLVPQFYRLNTPKSLTATRLYPLELLWRRYSQI